MKYPFYSITILFLILLFSCNKPKEKIIECTDPYAINYNKLGIDTICNYPSSQILYKNYEVFVTHYPLQPMQVGDHFFMKIVDTYYDTTIEPHHKVNIGFLNGISPEYTSIDLQKDMSFTCLNDTSLSWAGAYYYMDTSYFYGDNYDSVILNGFVHDGTKFYPVTMKGYN